MKKLQPQNFIDMPLNIVGSSTFGRYPKISVERTYNMIISDGFLVDYAGYKKVATIGPTEQGRGIYTSIRYNHMIVVIGNNVYAVASNLNVSLIGTINTFTGDVFIDENNNNQIAICDKQKLYIYNYSASTFQQVTLDFTPGYISFQDGRFIAADVGNAIWRLSDVGNGTSWPNDSAHVGTLQTKPDQVVAAQRFPGRGNLLYVFGQTVTESWQDVGYQLFPYQRSATFNLDYGCLNPATIAYNENIIVWLSANEKSGPAIMFSTGTDLQRISTDGIDFEFAQLTTPTDSYGFLFRQDGHLIYQITFPTDNVSYIYDFNTKQFFNVCDTHMNAHIAKRIAFFNDNYYFVSLIDGNLYQMSTNYTDFDGQEMPRIRVCRNIRLPDTSRFNVNKITFTIGQGTQPTDTTIPQAVDLSISVNGGQSFSNIFRQQLNPYGQYANRLIYWRLGNANDFVAQFRFWGLGRFVATDGVATIYQ